MGKAYRKRKWGENSGDKKRGDDEMMQRKS